MRYILIRADVEIWHITCDPASIISIGLHADKDNCEGVSLFSVKQHSKLIEVSVVFSSTVCLIFRHLLTVNRIVQGFPSIIHSHTVPSLNSICASVPNPMKVFTLEYFQTNLEPCSIYLSVLGTDTLGFETQKRVIVFLFLSECFKFCIRESLPEIRHHRRTCWMPQS